MSHVYGPPDERESIATIHRALELGVDWLDTADVYGNGAVETLVGRAIRGREDEMTISTKFGNLLDEAGNLDGVDGSPTHVERACEASLRRIGVETIDLFSLHRVDPTLPIEETVGAMAQLIEKGKVRFIGLSEAAPATVRRANAVHPIAALQTEYALWSRDPERELLDLCKELNIAFVAYSPLGRGFLTGRFRSRNDFEPGDSRPKRYPRFHADNFGLNIRIVYTIEEVAKAKGCTPAQVALAWVMAQGEHILPIPGTKRRRYLEENVKAVDVILSEEELSKLDQACPLGAAAGTRYPEEAMKKMDL